VCGTKSNSLIVVSFFLLIASASIGQSQPRPACLSYEPTVVRLTGMLVRQTFPGPPNYRSVEQGDRPETYWLLDLPTPMCVGEDKADPELNPEQTGIRRIQLVLQPEMFTNPRFLVGESVSIEGTIFGAHTGHHHTPILLTVRTLKRVKP